MEPLQNQKIRRGSESAVHRAVETRSAALPTREEVIAYIGGAPAPNGERAPARVTKRDIARVFGVKGEAKAELKLLIKDLQAEGAVAHGRKALTVEGRLPSLVVADIAEKDRYGELIAKPVEWTGDDPAPRILVRRPSVKRDRAPAPGVGARVLMRVAFDPNAGSKAPPYSGRVVKILDKMRARTFAVYRSAADGSGRAVPVEKRAAGREYVIPAGMAGEAKDGDLVAIEPSREGRLGLPPARVIETIGSVKSERAVSLIALETHHIPHVFSPATLKEAEDARPVRLSAARGLARVAARDDRSARRQGSRRRGPRRARSKSRELGRVHRHGRHRRRRRLRSTRHGDGSGGARARQLGLFPRPRRADAAGAHLQRPLLAARA